MESLRKRQQNKENLGNRSKIPKTIPDSSSSSTVKTEMPVTQRKANILSQRSTSFMNTSSRVQSNHTSKNTEEMQDLVTKWREQRAQRYEARMSILRSRTTGDNKSDSLYSVKPNSGVTKAKTRVAIRQSVTLSLQKNNLVPVVKSRMPLDRKQTTGTNTSVKTTQFTKPLPLQVQHTTAMPPPMARVTVRPVNKVSPKKRSLIVDTVMPTFVTKNQRSVVSLAAQHVTKVSPKKQILATDTVVPKSVTKFRISAVPVRKISPRKSLMTRKFVPESGSTNVKPDVFPVKPTNSVKPVLSYIRHTLASQKRLDLINSSASTINKCPYVPKQASRISIVQQRKNVSTSAVVVRSTSMASRKSMPNPRKSVMKTQFNHPVIKKSVKLSVDCNLKNKDTRRSVLKSRPSTPYKATVQRRATIQPEVLAENLEEELESVPQSTDRPINSVIVNEQIATEDITDAESKNTVENRAYIQCKVSIEKLEEGTIPQSSNINGTTVNEEIPTDDNVTSDSELKTVELSVPLNKSASKPNGIQVSAQTKQRVSLSTLHRKASLITSNKQRKSFIPTGDRKRSLPPRQGTPHPQRPALIRSGSFTKSQSDLIGTGFTTPVIEEPPKSNKKRVTWQLNTSIIKSGKNSIAFDVELPVSSKNKCAPTLDLKSRLESWLTKQGRTPTQFKHLSCFGCRPKDFPEVSTSFIRRQSKELPPPPSILMQDLQASPELKTSARRIFPRTDAEMNVLHSTSTENVIDSTMDDLDCSLVLQELNELIIMDYPTEHAEEWLEKIREFWSESENNFFYWDILAKLALRSYDTKGAMAYYEEALNKELPKQKNCDQYITAVKEKLAQMKTTAPNSGKKLRIDPLSVFQSTALKIGIQSSQWKRSGKASPNETIIATPVRRSMRLSLQSRKANASRALVCVDSLYSLPANMRKKLVLKQNRALE